MVTDDAFTTGPQGSSASPGNGPHSAGAVHGLGNNDIDIRGGRGEAHGNLA